MLDALWRRCWLRLCLATAARLAKLHVLAVVTTEAGGQGGCEVLDLNTTSPGYVLPTNLTVNPLEAGWRLAVTVGYGTGTAACVLLEDCLGGLRITALGDRCDGNDVGNNSFLNVPVPLGVWTSLGVYVAANTVNVSAQDGTEASVVTGGPPLPRNGQQQVALTGARGVEAAAGCRTSCPGYRHSSPEKDKWVTVKQWFQDAVHFYFRPGEAFVKLQYEVACTDTLGITMIPQVGSITLDPALHRHLWHVVHLYHHSGLALATLDNMPLRNRTLPEGCTFKRHTVKVMGDALFSFSCKPFNGDVKGVEDEGSSMAGAATDQAFMPLYVVVLAIIGGIILVLVLITVLCLVHDRQQLKTTINEISHKLDAMKYNEQHEPLIKETISTKT